MTVSLQRTKNESSIIAQIAARAVGLSRRFERPVKLKHIEMDVTAAHANGCALDLERLLAADDFNFAHDVFGIHRHIDRKTGRLGGCFRPRFATKQAA